MKFEISLHKFQYLTHPVVNALCEVKIQKKAKFIQTELVQLRMKHTLISTTFRISPATFEIQAFEQRNSEFNTPDSPRF